MLQIKKMKRRVNDAIVDNVAYYIEKRYRHVTEALAEIRRLLPAKGVVLNVCESCHIPYDTSEVLPPTSLRCYECSKIYACGRSFCNAPFNVVKCGRTNCSNMFCNSEARYTSVGCGQACVFERCNIVMCSTCTNECEECGLFYCDSHIVRCPTCNNVLCLNDWVYCQNGEHVQ